MNGLELHPACDYCRTIPGHDRSRPCCRNGCPLSTGDQAEREDDNA